MSESSAPKSAFTSFWLYKRKASWSAINGGESWAVSVEQLQEVLEDLPEGVELRGIYSSIGLTPDVEMIVWGVAPTLAELQGVAIAIDRTTIGQHLELKRVYHGSAGVSQYDPNHGPAFLLGKPAKRYLSVYPFTKTPDWFLLPYQERRRLMIEHGELGREYPSINTNTVNSFGIADQEFIVALEDDNPKMLIDMVQKLRGAEVRKWTAVDTPIYLGDRKPIAEVMADLRGR